MSHYFPICFIYLFNILFYCFGQIAQIFNCIWVFFFPAVSILFWLSVRICSGWKSDTRLGAVRIDKVRTTYLQFISIFNWFRSTECSPSELINEKCSAEFPTLRLNRMQNITLPVRVYRVKFVIYFGFDDQTQRMPCGMLNVACRMLLVNAHLSQFMCCVTLMN